MFIFSSYGMTFVTSLVGQGFLAQQYHLDSEDITVVQRRSGELLSSTAQLVPKTRASSTDLFSSALQLACRTKIASKIPSWLEMLWWYKDGAENYSAALHSYFLKLGLLAQKYHPSTKFLKYMEHIDYIYIYYIPTLNSAESYFTQYRISRKSVEVK